MAKIIQTFSCIGSHPLIHEIAHFWSHSVPCVGGSPGKAFDCFKVGCCYPPVVSLLFLRSDHLFCQLRHPCKLFPSFQNYVEQSTSKKSGPGLCQKQLDQEGGMVGGTSPSHPETPSQGNFWIKSSGRWRLTATS